MKLTDLIQSFHLIDIRARKRVHGGLSSAYRNVFRGQGLALAEVRAYVPGDDARLIDWNVTARMGQLHVKQMEEERELHVIIAIQANRAMAYGSTHRTKFNLAAQIASLLIFSAVYSGDLAGLIVFDTKGVQRFIPPKKGISHGFTLIQQLLLIETQQSGDAALSSLHGFLSHGLKRKSVVFVIGDCIYNQWPIPAFEVSAKRHDLITIVTLDPTETGQFPSGLFQVQQAEGDSRPVALAPEAIKQFQKRIDERIHVIRELHLNAGAELLVMETDASFEKQLHEFFLRRAQVRSVV